MCGWWWWELGGPVRTQPRRTTSACCGVGCARAHACPLPHARARLRACVHASNPRLSWNRTALRHTYTGTYTHAHAHATQAPPPRLPPLPPTPQDPWLHPLGASTSWRPSSSAGPLHGHSTRGPRVCRVRRSPPLCYMFPLVLPKPQRRTWSPQQATPTPSPLCGHVRAGLGTRWQTRWLKLANPLRSGRSASVRSRCVRGLQWVPVGLMWGLGWGLGHPRPAPAFQLVGVALAARGTGNTRTRTHARAGGGDGGSAARNGRAIHQRAPSRSWQQQGRRQGGAGERRPSGEWAGRERGLLLKGLHNYNIIVCTA